MGWFKQFIGIEKKVIDYTGPEYRAPGMWDYISGSMPNRWKNSGALFNHPSFGDMERAYNHPIVGACIDVIASAIIEPKLMLGKKDEEGNFEALAGKHDILTLLSKPNPYMSWADLLKQWVINAETTGIGYLWKIRDKGRRRVRWIIPIPTSWVTCNRAKTGGLVASYTIKGNEGDVPPEDIIMYRMPCPGDLLDSGAPLLKCWRDVILDRKRESFMVEILENLKIPGLVVTKKSGFGSVKKRKEAEAELEDRLGEASGRRGNTLFLEGDVEVSYHTPLVDLDWAGFSAMVESRVCTAFGVPAILIGCRYGLDRSTYSNMEQAEKSLYTRTCAPKWVALAETLDRGLIDEEGYEEDLCFAFGYWDLPHFQEDETETTTRVVMQYNSDLITREEARSELGFTEPFPEDEQQRLDLEAALERAQQEQQQEQLPAEGDASNTDNTDEAQTEEDKKKHKKQKSISDVVQSIELLSALKKLQRLNNQE